SIEGVRLPGLSAFLAATKPLAAWPVELRLLQSQLLAAEGVTAEEGAFLGALAEQPGDAATWAVYSDWLQEQGEQAAGLTVLRRALQGVCRIPAWRLDDPDPWRDYGRGPIGNAQEEVRRRTRKLTRETHHDPAKSRVQVGEHVAQLGLHVDRWGRK